MEDIKRQTRKCKHMATAAYTNMKSLPQIMAKIGINVDSGIKLKLQEAAMRQI